MPKLFYKTIESQYIYEIPKIKGSRFFVTLFPIETKEQAEEYLVQMKRKYYDATHNCSAYKVGVHLHYDLFGTTIIDPAYKKANDDGEPANTAGKPILSMLDGAGLQNVLLVVTRYFGGTLLGVGGLIQAYSQTAKEAIMHAQIIEKEIMTKIDICYGYDNVSLVQHLFSKYQTKIIEDNYNDKIQQIVEVNVGLVAELKKDLLEKGNGSIIIK